MENNKKAKNNINYFSFYLLKTKKKPNKSQNKDKTVNYLVETRRQIT